MISMKCPAFDYHGLQCAWKPVRRATCDDGCVQNEKSHPRNAAFGRALPPYSQYLLTREPLNPRREHVDLAISK